MKRPALELREVLEEEEHKCSNVLRRFFGSNLVLNLKPNYPSDKDNEENYHRFSVLGIRVTDIDGLINIKDVSVAVPRFFEEFWSFRRIGHTART
jgi:hypothetical protein